MQFAAVHESLHGTERTCRDVRVKSAFGGKPDLTIATADFRVDPSATSGSILCCSREGGFGPLRLRLLWDVAARTVVAFSTSRGRSPVGINSGHCERTVGSVRGTPSSIRFVACVAPILM